MRSPSERRRGLRDAGLQPPREFDWSPAVDVAIASLAIPAALRVVTFAAARWPGQSPAARALLEAGGLLILGLSITAQWRATATAAFRSFVPLTLLTAAAFAGGAGLAMVGDSQLKMSAGSFLDVWMLAAAEEVVFRRLVPRYVLRKLTSYSMAPVATVAALLLAQAVFAFSHPIASESGLSRWTSWLLLFDAGLCLTVVASQSLAGAIALHAAINAELSFGTRWRARPGLGMAVACCAIGIWLVTRLCRRGIAIPLGLSEENGAGNQT